MLFEINGGKNDFKFGDSIIKIIVKNLREKRWSRNIRKLFTRSKKWLVSTVKSD